jgi:hypothetical protein
MNIWPGAARQGTGKRKEVAGRSRVIKEDTTMDRSRRPKRPRDISAALTLINIKVSVWKRLARRRFETGDIADLAVFESHWPQILTNFFYAETARVSRALGWLSEDRNN